MRIWTQGQTDTRAQGKVRGFGLDAASVAALALVWDLVIGISQLRVVCYHIAVLLGRR
jgi:hypothetical protein